MTSKKPKKINQRPLRPLHPNEVVRLHEGRMFFGYGHAELDEKIKAGEIPAPFPLSEFRPREGLDGATNN